MVGGEGYCKSFELKQEIECGVGRARKTNDVQRDVIILRLSSEWKYFQTWRDELFLWSKEHGVM
jgi:hypothetical protein